MDRPAEAERAIRIEKRSGVAMLRFSSPILSLDVLDELSSTLETLSEKDERDPLVLHTAHPSVFLAGAHLAEIAALDAVSCEPYARRGRRTIRLLGQYPAPTVAAVDGSCSGGGFDLILACDVIVAGPGASFGHPGIRRGLVTGWSGTTRLPFRFGGATARAALLEARDLDAATLSGRGMIRHVPHDPLAAASETVRRLASLGPPTWRLWRALKDPRFIDRFHASVVHKL
jgi:enoyl-CoA hydratase/carnithine racemase